MGIRRLLQISLVGMLALVLYSAGIFPFNFNGWPWKPSVSVTAQTAKKLVAPKKVARKWAKKVEKEQCTPEPGDYRKVPDKHWAESRPSSPAPQSAKQTAEFQAPLELGKADVRKYYRVVKTRDVNGNPVTKKITITHESRNNLPDGKIIRRGFIWLPGQVMPPDWMYEVGGKMNGIDPENGNIRDMDVPTGIAINYNDRGNFSTVVGKFSKMPDDRHLLKKIHK